MHFLGLEKFSFLSFLRLEKFNKIVSRNVARHKQSFVSRRARQVGKTYLIDAFCKKYFENYIYINLALNPQAIPAFSQAKDVKDFLLVVSAFSASPLIPSKNNHIHR